MLTNHTPSGPANSCASSSVSAQWVTHSAAIWLLTKLPTGLACLIPSRYMPTRSAICAYPPRLKQRAPRPISPAARKLSGWLHATHRGGWGFCTGLGMTERGGIW